MNNRLKLTLLLFVLTLTVLSGGCQPAAVAPEEEASAPATETIAPPEPTATATSTFEPQASPTAPPAPTAAEGDTVVEVAVAGIALSYPAGLAEEVTVETIPATELEPRDWSGRWLARPALTALHWEGYPHNRELQQAHIYLVPVEAATSLQLRAEQRVEQLNELLLLGPETPLPADELPYLPVRNAAQLLHAKEAQLAFANGLGVRYLTAYAQEYIPVCNDFLAYTFQGITGDGRFYVSASFPVRSDALPDDIAAAQAGGWDGNRYHQDRLAYDDYIAEQVTLLNGLADHDFAPSLDVLDEVVRSLDLSGYTGPATEPWAAELLPGPDQVVDDFLERYTRAGGFWEGAHLEDPALEPDFMAGLEANRQAWETQGADLSQYDPILMSANLGGPAPFNFVLMEVGPALVEDGQARVPVERRSWPESTMLPLFFTLQWAEETTSWQITDVSTVLSHPRREVTAAEKTVEQVYSLGLADRPGSEGVNLEKLGLPSEVGSSLCAQDCPWGLAIEGAWATGETGAAGEPVFDLVVYTSFDNDVHTVRVEPGAAGYVVVKKARADTAVERARAFYSWYLSEAELYPESRWSPRQPQLAQMNGTTIFASERFLSEAHGRVVQEDPYLPERGVPLQFWTEAGADENSALVLMVYEDGEATLRLTFVEEKGRRMIDNISEESGS